MPLRLYTRGAKVVGELEPKIGTRKAELFEIKTSEVQIGVHALSHTKER